MRISGFDDPDSSGWDALHRGTEREGFDSPSKFDMSTLSMIMPKRKPSRPKPDPQGYTDEDTREWGSSSSAEDEDYERPEPPDYSRGHAPEFADEGYARREAGGYAGTHAPEFGDGRYTGPGRRGTHAPEFADEGYAPRESAGYPGTPAPEFDDDRYARPEHPGMHAPEFADDRYAPRESAGYPRTHAPEFADDRYAGPGHRGTHAPEFTDDRYDRYARPEPVGYPHARAPEFDDGYDPVEPEWQDGETAEPEPPPLEPAWTPPRGARQPAPPRPPAHHPPAHHPPAPRPPAPRRPAQGPPAPVSRPQAAPPPSWAPPPPADWTPPPDPETRWVPHPEPWEDPGWNEPARVASPAPVASAGSRVRPYTRTGGRTRSDHNLALEALVSTSDDGRRYRGVRSVEHRRICDLCLDTRSVAEIAAHLRLPLGVVKVLVGDMADIGLVLIHQTELILGDRSSREFMERVLAGLRAL
ncbi:DUF742 domain-containing protein [Amycolatopsis sp. A133]|uniref:DUF742 domain-containing protein n=1 Tax=Amycolatopsis sp. A133 TaxID=3064472 RepID=UPI0027F5981E|nr:DUF742 domain-containing protein [Amycolatopsis sp. A133]MDQ7805994.1 DUF742 domain-containing protein [Amycolatopsis sp. A133]